VKKKTWSFLKFSTHKKYKRRSHKSQRIVFLFPIERLLTFPAQFFVSFLELALESKQLTQSNCQTHKKTPYSHLEHSSWSSFVAAKLRLNPRKRLCFWIPFLKAYELSAISDFLMKHNLNLSCVSYSEHWVSKYCILLYNLETWSTDVRRNRQL